MILDMPFQHKFIGRYGKNGTAAVRICWDTTKIEVPHVPAQEFEPGSDLGDGITTLWRDESHWAYYGTSVTGRLDHRSLDDFGKQKAMMFLAERIDQRAFHDDCRVKALPKVLFKPPSDKYIETSERERNIARLQDWVTKNVAIVGPDLVVRVGDPSIRLYMTFPDTSGVCGIRIQTNQLTPLNEPIAPGIHVSIDDRYDLYMYAHEMLRKHKKVDDVLDVIGADRLRGMKQFRSSGEDMYEKTLRSLAYDANFQLKAALELMKTRKNSNDIFEQYASLLDDLALPTSEGHSDEYLCQAMEALGNSRIYLNAQTRIATDFALQRWDDRPVRSIAGNSLQAHAQRSL